MVTNGKSRYVPPECSLKPRHHLERVIFRFQPKDSQSDVEKFKRYLDERGAIRQGEYWAIGSDAGEKVAWNRVRCQASVERNCVSLRQVIPPLDRQDIYQQSKKTLQSHMVELTVGTIFQFPYMEQSNEGWLYVYMNGEECLYVGKTTDSYPVTRACEHLLRGKIEWSTHIHENRHRYQNWTVSFIRPFDCEHLIKSSFFLPNEDPETIMPQIIDQYHQKIQSQPDWLLSRAELVLIAVYLPKFNIQGKPFDG